MHDKVACLGTYSDATKATSQCGVVRVHATYAEAGVEPPTHTTTSHHMPPCYVRNAQGSNTQPQYRMYSTACLQHVLQHNHHSPAGGKVLTEAPHGMHECIVQRCFGWVASFQAVHDVDNADERGGVGSCIRKLRYAVNPAEARVSERRAHAAVASTQMHNTSDGHHTGECCQANGHAATILRLVGLRVSSDTQHQGRTRQPTHGHGACSTTPLQKQAIQTTCWSPAGLMGWSTTPNQPFVLAVPLWRTKQGR
mgnify:CR=1 FL=1